MSEEINKIRKDLNFTSWVVAFIFLQNIHTCVRERVNFGYITENIKACVEPDLSAQPLKKFIQDL